MMKIGDLAIHKSTGDIGLVLAVSKRFYKIQWAGDDFPWQTPKRNVKRIPT